MLPSLPPLLCRTCVVTFTQLFFAKVPRTATKEQIQALFASFGEVDSVNLFAPYEVRIAGERRSSLALAGVQLSVCHNMPCRHLFCKEQHDSTGLANTR